MEKIIRTAKDGTVQITIADERFYIDNDGIFWPSSTWISSFYPKGVEFYKWLAATGWDEAEEIKMAAGEKGTRVHIASEDVMQGKPVNTNAKYADRSGIEKELTPEECEAINSCLNFLKDVNPKIHIVEQIVKNKEVGYAGTMDVVCEIGGELGILDIKTSQSLYTSHKIQLSSYLHAFKGLPTIEVHGGKEIKVMKMPTKLWVLQLGYRRNERRWKLTEVEDDFEGFMLAHKLWQREAGKVEPKKLEFPEVFEWHYNEAHVAAPKKTKKTI
jgi:hypothetical protein